MDEVEPGLYVGDVHSPGRAAEFGCIVRLTNADPPDGYPSDPTLIERPLVDGPGCDDAAFAEAVEAVRAARERDESVLVHCSAGASRSVTVAATALAVEEDIPLEAALARVGAARDEADPHPALLACARQYLRRT